jgi:hypothetical protein
MRLIKPQVPIIVFSVQWALPEEVSTVADAILGKGQNPVRLLSTLQSLLRPGHSQTA